MIGEPSVARAALLVAVAALLQASLSPLLTFGWVGPKFVVLGIVIAATGQRDLQALLLGFFGGVLTDALGGGLFGVGALGGVAAATISVRMGATRRKGEVRAMLTLASAFAVAVYDVLGALARSLAGSEGPPFGAYLVGGILPDALLAAVLAYCFGTWLLGIIMRKEGGNEA